MRYSEKVQEHFNNPKNVGSLDREDPTVGTAVVGAPACGDVMQLQLQISDEGVIEDAKFKTFGCGSAIIFFVGHNNGQEPHHRGSQRNPQHWSPEA